MLTNKNKEEALTHIERIKNFNKFLNSIIKSYDSNSNQDHDLVLLRKISTTIDGFYSSSKMATMTFPTDLTTDFPTDLSRDFSRDFTRDFTRDLTTDLTTDKIDTSSDDEESSDDIFKFIKKEETKEVKPSITPPKDKLAHDFLHNKLDLDKYYYLI